MRRWDVAPLLEDASSSCHPTIKENYQTLKSKITIPIPITIHHDPHKGEPRTNHSPVIPPYTDIQKLTLDESEITLTHPVFKYLPDDEILEEVALEDAMEEAEMRCYED